MLVLQRRLGETVYIAEEINHADPDKSDGYKITIDRIVNSFDKGRVYASIKRLPGGDSESVVFTRDSPWVVVDPGRVSVKLISIDSLVYPRSDTKEHLCNVGFDADQTLKVVRSEVIRRTP